MRPNIATNINERVMAFVIIFNNPFEAPYTAFNFARLPVAAILHSFRQREFRRRRNHAYNTV
jgi:hypothetical protein